MGQQQRAMAWVRGGALVAATAAAGCLGIVGDASNDPPAADGPGDVAASDPEARPLRRLTRRELERTFEDLLGREVIGIVDAIPSDSLEQVYDRVGTAQSVSALHVEGHLAMAHAVATLAMEDAEVAGRLMPGCDDAQLGPRATATTRTVVGSALQGPTNPFLACRAGDVRDGRISCPEVTDPDEVKLTGDAVTLVHTTAVRGLYRIELHAAATRFSSYPATVEVSIDDVPVTTLALTTSEIDARVYDTYAFEAWLEPGEHRIRFAKSSQPRIYIRHASVIGPLDPDAAAQRAARMACADALVDHFAPRAWRRPLTTDESVALRVVLEEAWADAGLFFDGLHAALVAILMAPELLYHVEIGVPTERPGFHRLTPFELASRLSYLAWESPPDDALRAAAEAGDLETEEQIRAQAERLFADERAAETVRTFYAQWLSLHALEDLTKDTELFPEFTSDVRAAMLEETQTYLDRMTWQEGADVRALLTAHRTWMPPALAPIYGVAAGTGTAPIELPAERIGLLTQPSFLAIQSRPNRHSPVLRGTFILRRVLCRDVAEPPPDVDFSAPERTTGTTTRDRFVAHQSDPRCSACHSVIDPIGFVFEHFDGIGRFRTHENGVDIDATGGGPALGLAADALDGAVEMAEALASSEETDRCFARQWFRFGMGRHEAVSDRSSLEALEAALAEGGVRGLFVELATTDAFRHRIVEEEAQR